MRIISFQILFLNGNHPHYQTHITSEAGIHAFLQRRIPFADGFSISGENHVWEILLWDFWNWRKGWFCLCVWIQKLIVLVDMFDQIWQRLRMAHQCQRLWRFVTLRSSPWIGKNSRSEFQWLYLSVELARRGLNFRRNVCIFESLYIALPSRSSGL